MPFDYLDDMSQPVLFLAFANDPIHPLTRLSQEDDAVYALLRPRAVEQQHFHLHRESHATLDKLRTYFTEYENQLWLFHYAGHADSEQLFLASGGAQAGGMAAMLAEQKLLKLVFLNGCSTQPQVETLLRLGVPAVIATRAPINDALAQQFAWHFYHALVLGATLQEAFQAAANYAQAAGKARPILRSLVWEEDSLPVLEETWGLFHRPDRAEVLDERLPAGVREEVPASFEPNEQLIEAIWQALAEEGVVAAGRGALKLSKKRMDILNNLPAPVAEPLRKLFVPLDNVDEGYNKISLNRLRQLARTYQVLMELMAFTLLAQVWENRIREQRTAGREQGAGNQPIDLVPELKTAIRDFLDLPDGQRESFAFIPLIRQLRLSLDAVGVPYFVEELAGMAGLMAEDSSFRRACTYFDFLRQRLARESDAQLRAETGRLCVEAEQQLAAIFAELGFLARYTLATVKQIVVQKYRHKLQARFRHTVVRLVDLLGGMDEEEETFGGYLDSQSVLLLKEDPDADMLPFLNLSPFVIDENAFVANSDVSKIYFYHHRQPHPAAWAYRWVQRPTDPVLLVPGQEFGIVEEQIRAFIQLI